MRTEVKEILDRLKSRDTADLLRVASDMLEDYAHVRDSDYDNDDVADVAAQLEKLAEEFDHKHSPTEGSL